MVLMMFLYLIVIYIMLNDGGDNLGVAAQTSLSLQLDSLAERFHVVRNRIK